ncbi:MAG: hypothetical protein MUF25_03795 [Pirellulaceae bacterium]|nr:hypothetical protein [Pirellulaceae bacterium]
MSTRQSLLLSLVGTGVILIVGEAGAAAGEPAKSAGEPKAGGLASLLGALGEVQIPSLSGLIQPERMGVLTDNECRIEDNQPHLLSDNQADRDFLSGNQVNVLSGLHLLSDITVTVQVTVGDGDRKAAKAKKADGDRKSNKADKSRKRKTSRSAKGT